LQVVQLENASAYDSSEAILHERYHPLIEAASPRAELGDEVPTDVLIEEVLLDVWVSPERSSNLMTLVLMFQDPLSEQKLSPIVRQEAIWLASARDEPGECVEKRVGVHI
jgi:hypothetical protein